jgi:hypothetical protein
MRADLLLLSADPSADARVLATPAEHVRLVVKDGLLAAAPGGGGGGADGVNALLAAAPAAGDDAA